jgi:hypothetical protein
MPRRIYGKEVRMKGRKEFSPLSERSPMYSVAVPPPSIRRYWVCCTLSYALASIKAMELGDDICDLDSFGESEKGALPSFAMSSPKAQKSELD